MRSLAQPKVLGRALLAAILSCAACVPRLVNWDERGAPIALMLPMLLWAIFVMWGFVFAWHFQYSNRPVFEKFKPKLWGIVSLLAIGAAVQLHYVIDPALRVLTPEVYPTDWNSWVRDSLFAIALEPLFLCFAPFAFFIRLTKKQDAALALTVVFGLFVLALRINSGHAVLSAWLLVELVCMRVLGSFVGLYLYLRGGALLIWWVSLIGQFRLILDFF